MPTTYQELRIACYKAIEKYTKHEANCINFLSDFFTHLQSHLGVPKDSIYIIKEDQRFPLKLESLREYTYFQEDNYPSYNLDFGICIDYLTRFETEKQIPVPQQKSFRFLISVEEQNCHYTGYVGKTKIDIGSFYTEEIINLCENFFQDVKSVFENSEAQSIFSNHDTSSKFGFRLDQSTWQQSQ